MHKYFWLHTSWDDAASLKAFVNIISPKYVEDNTYIETVCLNLIQPAYKTSSQPQCAQVISFER